ncbi:hypothetical protein [Methylobacterium oryzisoli]|uniref:hypothetical protein n=1 Tax=Methylobacterium oryzisoli TaxID=3385502 RepID=UPI003892809A
MTHSGQWQRTLDAILTLTDEIARLSPDCADRALTIARLVRDLDPAAFRRRERPEDCLEEGMEDEPEVGPLHPIR